MDVAAHSESVVRFRDDLAALGVGPSATLGVAVSGGSDSLALLLLARAARTSVAAATVDHGLRATSAHEATFVAALCERIGVRHETLRLEKQARGNVSAWARQARYEALTNWAEARGLDHIATAHHADDQLETMIMRLNRGSGVAGLSGIRAVNGKIVRPLLGWRKSELTAIVEEGGITPVDDPTNRDNRFDRARLRKVLATVDWLDPVAVAKSATLLAEAEAALEWFAETGALPVGADGVSRVLPATLPAEVLRRLVLRGIKSVDPDCAPRGESLTRVIAALRRGEIATIGRVICIPQGDRWSFTPAPPRRAGKRDAPAPN